MSPSGIKKIFIFSKRAIDRLTKADRVGSSFCSAVIAAAGSSQRCAGEDKLLYKINGKPLLVYTIESFDKSPLIREIIVVARKDRIEEIADLCKAYDFCKVSKIITGGDTRTESVINGVFAVSKKAKLIAIHDGARPCIDSLLIEKTVEAAAKYHAAAPGVPVASTLKRAKTSAVGNFGTVIEETVDRDNIYEIQTPQVFKADIIKAGLTKAVKSGITLTDDCMAAERLGMPVHIVQGSRINIKVTDCDDLHIAGALLGAR